MFELLPLIIFSGLLLFAAASDIATMTIPNWVSIVIALAFPITALISALALSAIGWHLAFGFAVLAITFGLFQFGVLGGGDAKLIAAAAVWTGIGAFGAFAFWTSLAGGVLALTLLLARAMIAPDQTRPTFLNRLLTRRGGIPYGVAIAVGGLAVLHLLPTTSA